MMKRKKYSGVIVPMVTPFTQDRQIDQNSARKSIKHVVSNGAMPFILGTTGESASIPEEYRLEFVKNMVETAGKQTVTYAGISGNCLKTSIESAQQYFDQGVDVMVAHPPGYYPLNEDQILNYFEELIESIPGPLILYNIPPVTGLSLPLDVVEKLSHHPRIVGLKDSERDPDRLEESLRRWVNRPDFSYLSGWATVSAEALLKGCDGIVPSTGNLVPKMYQDLYEAGVSGDGENARKLQNETDEISLSYQKGFILSHSLAAFKIVLNEAGLCEPYVLPPLKRLSPELEQGIREQLRLLNKKYALI